MALHTPNPIESDRLPTVDQIMAERGYDRFTAELYLAGLRGDGLANDLVCVPSDQREAILRAGEEIEAALFAAIEHVDSAASVEANMDRLGLDRQMAEAALILRRRVGATALAGEMREDSLADEE
jgi:hypothetical protein